MTTTEKSALLSLTDKEKNLIELLRTVPFGEVHVYMADGQPVRVEEIKKSIKL